MRAVAGIAGLLCGVCGVARVAGTADAQALPPITDRDWAIDLHDGAALGTVRIVGMGGTAVAVGEGSAGALFNPAAVAVRRATSNRRWDWDWHADALSAVYASDFDNNGLEASDEFGVRLATAGLAGMIGRWGLAVAATTMSARFDGPDQDIDASTHRAKIALARSFDRDEITIGGAVRIADLTLTTTDDDTALFSLVGTGFELGVVWRPPVEDLRLGGTVSLPVRASRVEVEGCDPMDCAGYILPERVEVPWQIAVGAAWREGPTPWNQRVPGPFRDEPAVLIAADVIVTGAVADGHGLEAFGRRQWQRSGRTINVSARAGIEWERIPGRLRLRGGTYWEPGRFAGVGGRAHITAGVEVGFFDFYFFGRRRLRLSVTADAARRYGNAGLSLGFWH